MMGTGGLAIETGKLGLSESLLVEPGQASLDAELAQRWQAGDHGAGDTLIRRYRAKLHAFICSRAASAVEAEDLTQEVLVAVSRKLDLYRPELPFGAWLYGIARNKIADAWRRHRPIQAFEPHHEGIDHQSPADLHASAEDARVLWEKVFELLPENQATALWLKVQEEFSLEEIAVAIGTTPGNVKVLLFRARQTLAQRWKKS